MSTYSLDGYLVAVKVRTARTLLVEGPSDKVFADRLISDLDCAGRARQMSVVVDTSSIVRISLGAREVVEAVHARSTGLGLVFAGLVDREFRCFRLSPDFEDEQSGHKIVDGNLFWTRGHSIENYFFTPSSVMKFLRMSYPHLVNGNVSTEIERAFGMICAWAVALSVAAHQSSTLERFAGVLKPGLWSKTPDGQFNLDQEELGRLLLARGASQGQIVTFTAELTRALEAARAQQLQDTLRWLAHGHIGSEVVWTVIATLLQAHGASSHESDQIGRGARDAKFRAGLDHWAETRAVTVVERPEDVPLGLIGWCAEPLTQPSADAKPEG